MSWIVGAVTLKGYIELTISPMVDRAVAASGGATTMCNVSAHQLAPTFDPDRWVPPPEQVGGYRISGLVRHTGAADLRELLARAAAEPDWFYPLLHEFLGAAWMRPYTGVRAVADSEPFARWFVGGGTNLAWVAAERWIDHGVPAIIWESDDGQVRELSYAELAAQVSAVASGLRRLGVAAGDVVTMHLPVVPEAVITMLAVARIGAIVAPAFSGYGADPLAERLRLGGAKVIVTADGTLRRGKRVDMLTTALRAVELQPVDHVVVVSRLGAALPAHPLIRPWSELAAEGPDGPMEIFDTDTPWLLAFTSGSSGRPKGAVHTHGGMTYSLMSDLGLSLDVGPGDRFAWPADMGWLAGPMAGLGPLTLGATTVLFDGVIDYPQPDRAWKLIEKHRLTHYGLAPTVARAMAGFGERWVEPYGLESLRVIASSGEPWTRPAWQWLHRHVGRGRAPIINWSGGTEIGGPILVGYPSEPTEACRFTGPAAGLDVAVVDPVGRRLTGQLGELALRRSWPNMTRGLWREPERYVESYWAAIPGMWVHGDRAIQFEDGSYEVPGRSDDVMKIAGKRVGPSELEAVACEVDGVLMAAAIGFPDERKGQVPVLVVRADDSRMDLAGLGSAVADHVAAAFGKPMRPAAVLIVDELPLTRSGKIHRRVLRGWLTGEDPGDLSTLENPGVHDSILRASTPLRAGATG
jgi:acetyl-CoA synthetase